MTPTGILFDLDETLAQSKQPIAPDMAVLLTALLTRVPVGIISGSKYDILIQNVAEKLRSDTRYNLYLLPTCGASLHYWDGEMYRTVYEELLTRAEEEEIQRALHEAMAETGVIDLTVPSHGERIECRGCQVTLSALGQVAPLEHKQAWDPDRVKRPILRDAIARRLPAFDVKTGGSTSIDVTKPGINKAYGVRKFAEHLSLSIPDLLYIGDALFPGGNDEVVRETGIPVRETTGPSMTADIIREVLG